jgi:predicted aldo/keto reductase-like oxidoreductase
MKRDEIRSRRDFLKGIAGGAAVLGASLTGPAGSEARIFGTAIGEALPRRRLGRTGLSVSEISLGSSPLPDPYLTRTLVDRGINYIDSSHNYENGNSERKIGRLLKEVGRDKIHVGTKFHVTAQDTETTIIDSVHGSLRRLGTDFVDVLLIHGADSAEVLVDGRVLGAFERLKKEGGFRFRGLSCHSNHAEVVREAVGCGLYDMVQVGFNVFDIIDGETRVETYPDYLGTSGIRGLIELARSRDIGVIAMKTLKVGGRRQDLGRYRTGTTSIYQAMIKWVLEDSRVASALIEIMSHKEMEEDLAAAGSALTAAERETLARFVGENGTGYCQLCGRCARVCPAGVATTRILHALSYHESYGKTDRARRSYAELKPGEDAASCRDCGACEKICPFGVAVRSKIRAARLLLA